MFSEIDAGFSILEMGQPQCGIEPGIIANDRQPVVEQLDRVIDRVVPPPPRFLTRAEVALVRVQVIDGALDEPPYAFSGSVLRFVKGRTAIDFSLPDAAVSADDGVGCAPVPVSVPRVCRQASISDLEA